MNKFWSPLTRNLDPYVPGEQPQDNAYIKLNTNENPYPPSPLAMRAIGDAVSEQLRLYPDPDASRLRQAIADVYQVDVQGIFAGNGSDEVLAFAFMAFFKQASAISFPDISYSFYPVYCNIFEIPCRPFALTDNFEIDIDRIPHDCGGIIFPNPNAPTGVYLGTDHIETLLQRFPDRVVIVDEAYIDFGGDSCVPLVDRYPNLLVIQTLSKSRSLAGMRVGFAIGHEDLVSALNRVKNSFNSYPLDALAIAGASAAMQDRAYFNETCRKIIDTREWLIDQLTALSFQVLPSQANFVFARHADHEGAALYRQLKQQGILVRHFGKPGIEDFLRITIGTQTDMERFCEVLASITGKNI
jgi:histidinol-phosphate aminotransferase